MPKPRVFNKFVQYHGYKAPSLFVEYADYKKTILVFDSKYNLNDQSENTFVGLCHECGKTDKRFYRFIYMDASRLTREDMLVMCDQYNAESIVFAEADTAHRFDPDAARNLGLLKTSKEGIKYVLSTPFYRWSHSEGFVKGETGKNLLGFNVKHMLAAARGKNPFKTVDPSEVEFPIRLVKTIKQFKRLMQRLYDTSVVCIDTEAASLAKITNTLFTIQFGFEIEEDVYETYILPWKHKDHVWTDAELAYIRKTLRTWCLTSDAVHVFHFAKFDIEQLCVALGIDIYLADVWDTIGSQFCVDENHKFLQRVYGIRSPYSLEVIEGWFDITRPAGLIEKKDRSNMARFSLEDMSRYGAYDVVTPLIIRKRHRQMCTDRFVGYDNVEDFDRVVIHQLGVMSKTFSLLEVTGIYIDQKNAKKLTEKNSVFVTALQRIKDEIASTEAGKKANRILQQRKGLSAGGGIFSSQEINVLELTRPSHLKVLFIEVLKLEARTSEKTGEPSFDKAFQARYKKTVPEVNLYTQYNKVKTLKSNFADGIVKLTNADPDFRFDGRMRANFGYQSVLTGRISVIKPTTQNIPVRTDKEFELGVELVKAIKKNFTVAPGRVMLGSDFSAHEIRIGGDLAKDAEVAKVFILANEAIRKYRLAPTSLIDAAIKVLAREGDIHISNVRFFFQQEVDKGHILRYRIKSIVFGVIYGKMAKGLARELGITDEEAQALIDVLFQRWAGVKQWMDNTFAEGAATYMVRYPNNRIRHLWGYLDDDIWVKRAMDRRGINSPIQGFASDIGVVSIYESARWRYENITAKGYILDMKNTNVVHDAQYNDTLYAHMPFALWLTEHAMSTLPMDYYKRVFNYEISIPLNYGMEFGTNWSNLKEWSMRTTTYTDMVSDPEKPKVVSGIYDMLRDLGKELGVDYDKTIEDAKYMMKIRTKELEKDPYKMLITNNNIGKVFEDLHMFRDQDLTKNRRILERA